LIHNTGYYLILALLGCRNEYQSNMSAKERMNINYTYIRNCTNYPSNRYYLRLARKYFAYAVFDQQAFYGLNCKPRGLYALYLNNFVKNICLIMAHEGKPV
jgi:hypothetical protein